MILIDVARLFSQKLKKFIILSTICEHCTSETSRKLNSIDVSSFRQSTKVAGYIFFFCSPITYISLINYVVNVFCPSFLPTCDISELVFMHSL